MALRHGLAKGGNIDVMRIQVINYGVKVSQDKIVVVFRTKYGDTRAIWQGTIPPILSELEVEFEIQGILTWGLDIVAVNSVEPRIFNVDDSLHIRCVLESIEPDGYTVVRVDNSIIVIETEGTAPPVGTWVEVKSVKVLLYDSHI